jgi:hypothetical protein
MATQPHEPSKPVASKEQLKELLLAGLASGEPTPVSRQDWEALRQRALANTDIRESG